MSKIHKALSEGFDQMIRDPVWSDIAFDEALFSLGRHPVFGLLDGVRQLGPVALVYPGATHSRRAHSLGVYHIARRFVLALAERGRLDFASFEGVRAFLVAALCHDLGHFPYAHSLKDLPLASHEAIAGELLLEGSLRVRRDCGADPEQCGDHRRGQAGLQEETLYTAYSFGVVSR